MRSIYFRALVISLLFFNSLSFAQVQGRATAAQGTAQTQAPQPSPEQLKAQAELEKKSFALLEEVLADSVNLKLPENKLYVNFILADLLWKKDEKRARELYEKSKQIFTDYINNLNLEGDEYPQIFEQIQQLRQEVLQQLVNRDVELALDFLRATKLANPYGENSQQELMVEANLANQVAQHDPKKGLKLAKENLAKGLSSSIVQSLFSLQSNDPKGAAELAQAILQKIRTEDLFDNNDSFYAAMSFFHLTNQENKNRVVSPDPKRVPLLSQSEFKELADIILTYGLKAAATNNTQANSNFTSNILNQLEDLEKLFPTKVAELKAKTGIDKSPVTQMTKAYEELNKLTEKASVEEILAAGKKAKKEIQNNYIEQAAAKAYQQGNTDLAGQILTENIKSPSDRKSRLDNYAQSFCYGLLAANKLDDAYQAIQQLKNTEHRLNLLASLIQNYKEKGNKQRVQQLLDEAYSLINKDEETHNQFNQILSIVAQYIEVDASKGVSLLSPISHRLNEIVNASIIMEKFEGNNNASRLGELFFRREGSTINIVTEYNSVLIPLAKNDFEQAKSLTDQFQRTDLRLISKLSLLRGLLSTDSQNQ